MKYNVKDCLDKKKSKKQGRHKLQMLKIEKQQLYSLLAENN